MDSSLTSLEYLWGFGTRILWELVEENEASLAELPLLELFVAIAYANASLSCKILIICSLELFSVASS